MWTFLSRGTCEEALHASLHTALSGPAPISVGPPNPASWPAHVSV